jgi:uncharacterized protein YwgA
MKAKELILRILQIKPNLSTTRLAKLCYLFDLAWVQLHGKQKTEIGYEWWQYGPYSQDFESAVWELEESQKIQKLPYKTTIDKHDCMLHSAVDTKHHPIGKEEEQVLQYILQRYSGWELSKLLQFVYATAPMKEAQKKKARFKPLNMQSCEGIGEDTDQTEVAQMILRSELTDRREYVPASAFLRRLESRTA